LFKIDVLAVDQYLAQYSLMTIEIMVFDRNDLTGDQIGQVLLGFRAENLFTFWSVDFPQPDDGLCMIT
jgi:hypothetical protein